MNAIYVQNRRVKENIINTSAWPKVKIPFFAKPPMWKLCLAFLLLIGTAAANKFRERPGLDPNTISLCVDIDCLQTLHFYTIFFAMFNFLPVIT